MERRHAAHRCDAARGQRRRRARQRRGLVEQRGGLEHFEASAKAAPLELERPRVPAASASRRLLLPVQPLQPLQPLQRALDLRDLLLDGVRPITARVFWTSVIATVSSKSCSVDLRSKVDERCMGGWALACAERVCTHAAMAASGAAAGLRGTGGLTA